MSALAIIRQQGASRGGPFDFAVDDIRRPASVLSVLAEASVDHVGVGLDAIGYSDDDWLALARSARDQEADLVMAIGGLKSDFRRKLGAEGLRHLDPTAACAMVFRRERLVDILRRDAGLSGDHWLWTAGAGVAASGRLHLARDLRRGGRSDVVDAPPEASGDRSPTRRILVLGKIDASVSLYFDGLPPDLRAQLRFRNPTSARIDRDALLAADAVILIRELQRFAVDGTIRLLRETGVPHYYFADDSFITLRREHRDYWFYEPRRMAEALRSVSGIMVTSDALAAEYARFGAPIIRFDLALDPALGTPRARHAPGGIHAALPGGLFRERAFRSDIAGALVSLAATVPVRLLVRPDFAATGLGAVDVAVVPLNASFAQFIRQWRSYRPSVLLHPRSATANDVFKTPNALLVAHYLDAVPVVADGEPAYAPFGADDGVLRARDADEWAEQIRRAHGPEREDLLARLEACCALRFAGAAQTAALRDAIDRMPPLGQSAGTERRLRAARVSLPAWPLLRFSRLKSSLIKRLKPIPA